jgi:hypothetical protein
VSEFRSAIDWPSWMVEPRRSVSKVPTELEKAIELAPEGVRARIKSSFEKGFMLCESPLEIAILPWLIAQSYRPFCYPLLVINADQAKDIPATSVGLVPQFSAGVYRADFGLVSKLMDEGKPKFVLVECDGRAFHEKTRDARRDAVIRKDEDVLDIVRLKGSEIFQSPEGAARVVARRFILAFGARQAR